MLVYLELKYSNTNVYEVGALFSDNFIK